MIVLFVLLGSLLFLPLLAQSKDKDEVIQKSDIIFKTEADESSQEKKPATPKSTLTQPVTPAQEKEGSQKAKPSSATPQGTTPSSAPSSTGASHEKEKAPDTKAPVKAPSPVVSKPGEASSGETKQAGTPIPSEPKKEGPTPSSTSAVPASTTSSQASLQEILQQAYECLQKDKKYEARNLYSQALFMETSEERRQMIRKHLEELNNALVFSSTPSPDFIVYKIQPGDNLTRIAKQYNTTAELLMRLNRKSSTLLRVGEPLKILRGKTSLLVDKSDFTLTLLLDGYYLKQYPIGTGKNDKTPEGKFIIDKKIKEPTWYPPDGKVYPYGTPQNILGTRWMGFQDQPGLTGYGIHGTTEPESIGTESSNGCIRMYNQDVEELYDYITPGTEVIIQR